MSIILQSACIRFIRHLPLRGARCYGGLSLPLGLTVRTRINYFMPKSMEFEQKDKLTLSPHNLRTPDGFSLIYNFKEFKFLQWTSWAALFLSLGTVYAFYEYKKKRDASVTDSKEVPIPFAKSESPEKEAMSQWESIKLKFTEDIYKSDPLYSCLILPFIVLILLYMRTSVVLCSYRRGNEYITSLTTRFGFGSKIVEHGPQEVTHYPHRKIYQYELKGEKVLLFSEYFVNPDEEDRMCCETNTNLKEQSKEIK